MNQWEQHTWDARQAERSPRLLEVSDYERLCRMAQKRGFHVELRLDAHGLSDIRLSNALSEDLYGIDDLDRASRVLQMRLRTERFV